MRSKTNLFLLILCLLLLLAPACGGSGGDNDDDRPRSSRDDDDDEEETEEDEDEEEQDEDEDEDEEEQDEDEDEDEEEQDEAETEAEELVPEVALGELFRSDADGLTFATLPDFTVESFGGMVSMMGPNADPDIGPAVALLLGDGSDVTNPAQLMEEIQSELAGDELAEITFSDPETVEFAGYDGLQVEFAGAFDGAGVNGRLLTTITKDGRALTLFAAAPAAQWPDFSPRIDAVVASIELFAPVVDVAEAEVDVVEETVADAAAAEEIRQWAAGAIASSEYGSENWSAMQATGAPDTATTECADLPTAWASYDNYGEEWLELTYETPVVPTELHIRQTHSPDQVVLVELIDTAGVYHDVYTGEPQNLWDDCPYTLSIPLAVKYEVVGVRISINQTELPWTEIDAVELVGHAASGEIAADAPAVVPETAEVSADGMLQVHDIATYSDRWGNFYVVGLVTNESTQPLSNVQMSVDLLDDQGNSLYQDNAWMSLYLLGPGETTPFRLTVYEELEEVAEVTAVITHQDEADFTRPDVAVRGAVRSIDEDGNIHITGELVNNGDVPVEINGIAAATFDGDGALIAADSQIVKIGYLDPGAAGPFRIYIYGPTEGLETITTQTFYLDALTTDVEEPWPLTFSSDPVIFLDEYNDVHLVGEITNSGEEILNVRLLGSFYDAEGNVLDADTFSMVMDLAPGETLPFDMVGGWTVLEHTPGLWEQVTDYRLSWDPFWTWNSNEVTVSLSTAEETIEFDGANGFFSGQIVNDSGDLVDRAVILVGLRDGDGLLLATGYDTSFDDLPAGDSVEYRVDVTLPEGVDGTDLDVFYVVSGERP